MLTHSTSHLTEYKKWEQWQSCSHSVEFTAAIRTTLSLEWTSWQIAPAAWNAVCFTISLGIPIETAYSSENLSVLWHGGRVCWEYCRVSGSSNTSRRQRRLDRQPLSASRAVTPSGHWRSAVDDDRRHVSVCCSPASHADNQRRILKSLKQLSHDKQLLRCTQRQHRRVACCRCAGPIFVTAECYTCVITTISVCWCMWNKMRTFYSSEDINTPNEGRYKSVSKYYEN